MIENRRKIVFTESAVKRLEKLHRNVDYQIENYLIDRKFVPGDDFIEVTGSDIDDVENRLKIIGPSSLNSKRVILNIYAIIGAITFLIGIFYSEIKDIVNGDRERLVLLIAGLSFSLASLFLSYYFRQRDKRQKDFLEIEERKFRSNELKSHRHIEL